MDWVVQGYTIAGVIAVIVSALVTLHTWEHRRYARSRVGYRHPHPPAGRIALFVPCKGLDDNLEANLRGLLEQDNVDYEITFIVDSDRDDACPVISRLRAEYPQSRSRLIIAGASIDSGQKVHNLLVATQDLAPEVTILAFVDTDVRPPHDWLFVLTQRLREYSAASGYRWFIPKRVTLANNLLSSVNGAVASIMSPGKHHTIWGGSWAVRRDVFESCGIREAWRGTLSDDLIATRMLAQSKQRVSFEPACMVPSQIDISLGGMMSFLRRQLTIGRFYWPSAWVGSVLMIGYDQVVFWSGVVAAVYAVSTSAPWAWRPLAILALSYALRVYRGWLRQGAARAYLPFHQSVLAGARRCDIWLGPLVGLTTFCALLISAVGKRIVWRGIGYEMRYGGQIRRLPPAHAAHGADVAQPPARKAA